MKTIAIIPARSGSKVLPDKNIKLLNGKPLLAYSIEAALNANAFDAVHVSTDSEKYAEISKKFGADVPFIRSESTSTDTASSWDVVREVLLNYQKLGQTFDYVALLQPTSPLRSAEDIRNAFAMLSDPEIATVVSVTETSFPVQLCFKLDDTLSLEEYAHSPCIFARRQELDTYYQENGAVYFVDAQKIMDSNYDMYKDRCFAYIMPRSRSVDIDEEIDFVLAETIIKNTNESKM